ncbi:CG11395 [Drosophila busckii]|uniref:CG11395 n=1 Tax=Drosophila busckii TaxID=30019 RepID=A0A0M4EDE8_DROBS|nr:uncharacterized protein LOC108595575 [Drosophila busckii]ALC40988.1 CG11395 [Drosophila busckii]
MALLARFTGLSLALLIMLRNAQPMQAQAHWENPHWSHGQAGYDHGGWGYSGPMERRPAGWQQPRFDRPYANAGFDSHWQPQHGPGFVQLPRHGHFHDHEWPHHGQFYPHGRHMDPGSFPGQGEAPLQPRPFPEQEEQAPANPLQPRPIPSPTESTDAQQQPTTDYVYPNPTRPSTPVEDQLVFSRRLQPRPEPEVMDYSKFNFPHPDATNPQILDTKVEDPTAIQPRPIQEQPAGHLEDYTIQPRPAAGNVQRINDAIASIFSDKEYLSPQVVSSSDPKAQAGGGAQIEYIGTRNLFETSPVCAEGTELKAGHCRYKA